MKHTTPLSRLANTLNVDISSMNRADAQDAVCKAAIIELDVKEGQLNNLAGNLADALNKRDELKITALALPNEQGTNRYGVDVAYFRKTINRELNRPLDNFKSDELARVFMRLAMTADKSVISEPEFSGAMELTNSNYPEIPDGSVFECAGGCNKKHPASDLKNTNITGSMTGVCRECWGFHPDIMIWTELPDFVPSSATPTEESPKECPGCRYSLGSDHKCHNPYCSDPYEKSKEADHD